MDTIRATAIIDFSLGVIGALILISALTKVRLISDLFHFNHFWEQGIAIIYFASATTAFIGLLRLRIWGFIAAYTHILIATIFLSNSVLPFLFNLFSLDYKTAATMLLISNLTILFFIGALHCIKRALNKKSLLTSE